MQTQSFPFSPPQAGLQPMTQASSISSVPLDGSASVVVPFLSAFASVCNAVSVQYAPTSANGYIVTTEVTAVSVNGFTLTANGGPTGTTGTFTYQAQGY